MIMLMVFCIGLAWADAPAPVLAADQAVLAAPTVEAVVQPVVAETDTGPPVEVQSDADEPIRVKSVGVTLGDDSLSLTYINDGKDYGLAFGAPLWRREALHSDGLLIFEPQDKEQLAAGWCVGYDFQLSKQLTLTPLVGVLTDITKGYDGRETQPFYGLGLNLKYH